MFIGLIITTMLLFVFALSVRLAGTARILNFVQYENVSDRRALHVWAGNRLLGLAAVTGLFALLAARYSGAAIFFLLAFIIAAVVAVSGLVAGSSKFHRRH